MRTEPLIDRKKSDVVRTAADKENALNWRTLIRDTSHAQLYKERPVRFRGSSATEVTCSGDSVALPV
jgi:hypothetical protein